MGTFDKDRRSKEIKLVEKKHLVDKIGRKVNAKGYLIDEKGNVIDKKGRVMFQKEALLFNEIPKIMLGFTKLEVYEI